MKMPIFYKVVKFKTKLFERDRDGMFVNPWLAVIVFVGCLLLGGLLEKEM